MSQDSGARKRAIPTEFAFGTDYPPSFGRGLERIPLVSLAKSLLLALVPQQFR
jgi:hypothetical protein